MPPNDKDYTLIYDGNPLLGDALVLPEQFFPQKGWRTPERNFVWALFYDALSVLMGWCAATKRQREADLQWLLEDTSEVMDFRWCCQVLDLNPKAIREQVLLRQKPYVPERKHHAECRMPTKSPSHAYHEGCRCPRCRGYMIAQNKRRRSKNALHSSVPQGTIESKD